MPPAMASAAAHAERIRQAAEERDQAPAELPEGVTTVQLYAERALAGVRADEALRKQARDNDRRARGEWVPGVEDDAEEADEHEDEPDDEPDDVEPKAEDDEPVPTWEQYAARERERIAAGRAATRVAHRGAVGPRQPPPRSKSWQRQPHRYMPGDGAA